MVYKKYIKRNGKTFGPYYYESYRENGKVKTRFISGPKDEDKKNWGKAILWIILFLLILGGVGYYVLDNGFITGNVIGISGNIVNIISAVHLDSESNLMGDVFEMVSERDDNWLEVNDGEVVKVEFEKELSSKNDISFYGRGDGRVDVYPSSLENEVVMSFDVNEDKLYKKFLDNLKEVTSVFYLKVTGDVEFDWIFDPELGTDAGPIPNDNVWNNSFSEGVSDGYDLRVSLNDSVYVVGTVGGETDWAVLKINATNGTLIWNVTAGLADSGIPRGVVIDSEEYVYAVGHYGIAALGQHFYAVKYNSSGGVNWTYDPSIADLKNDFNDVEVDNSTGVYIAGVTNETSVDTNGYLIKLNATTGAHLWNTSYDVNSGNETFRGVSTDNLGFVYVVGSNGTDPLIVKYNASNGAYVLNVTEETLGEDDFNAVKYYNDSLYVVGDATTQGLLSKYNASNGSQIWSINQDWIGSPGVSLKDVDVDSSGNPHFTGNVSGSFIFAKYLANSTIEWNISYSQGIGRGINLDVSNHVYGAGTNAQQIHTVRFNATSTDEDPYLHIWNRSYGSINDTGILLDDEDVAYGLSVDEDDNVYVVGASNISGLLDFYLIKYNSLGTELFNYSESFNVGRDRAYAVGAGNNETVYLGGDGYNLVKLNGTDGTKIWNVSVSSAFAVHSIYALDIDNSDNIYVTGESDYPGGDESEIYTFAYNKSGDHIWNQTYRTGIDEVDVARGISVDNRDSVYVVGETGDSPTLCRVIKYNATNGNQIYNFTAFGSVTSTCRDIEIDSNDNIYLAGTFANNKYIVMSLNSSQDQLWNYTLSLTDSNNDAYSLVIDNTTSPNIYVTGSYNNSANIEYLTIKLNSSGNHLWNVTYNGTNSSDYTNIARGIGISNDGAIHVTGYSGNNSNYDFYTIEYGVDEDQNPISTLSSPRKNNHSDQGVVSFVCNGTDDYALTNVTLYVWNSSDGLIHKNSSNWTGTTNSTTFGYDFNFYNTTTWNCLVNDNSSQRDWAINRTLVVTNISTATVNITTPSNNTNSSSAGLDVNYTATSVSGIDSCWYSNDSMTVNTTLASCVNITTVIWAEGQHNVTVWANNSFSGVGSDSVTFTIDTTAPDLDFVHPTPFSGETVYIDLVVNITFGGDNVTIRLYNSSRSLLNTTTSTSSPVYLNYSSLTSGVYFLNASSTDNSNNVNNSVTNNYLVQNYNTSSNGTVESEYKINESRFGDGTQLDGDLFGYSVTNIGDLDGDGIQDLAVGEPGNDEGTTDNGAVWIFFMNRSGAVDSEYKINESRFGDGTQLDGDLFGYSIANIGDLDGDGVQDLAVGEAENDDGGSTTGAVWILFLNTSGGVKDSYKINTSRFGNGSENVGDRFGSALTGLGDLNQDGVQDIAVGEIYNDDGGLNQGVIWILFLNRNGSVSSEYKINESRFSDGSQLDVGDNFGESISNIGDIDKDGIIDIAVGVPGDDDGASGTGAVWILFLNTSGGVDSDYKINVSRVGNGSELKNGFFGWSVEGIGDLNNDSVNDIVVGETLNAENATDNGAVWILFLNTSGGVDSDYKINVSRFGNGNELSGDQFGYSIANLGDLNNDGATDIAVGEPYNDDGATSNGAVWILFLNSSEVVDSGVGGGGGSSGGGGGGGGSATTAEGDSDGDSEGEGDGKSDSEVEFIPEEIEPPRFFRCGDWGKCNAAYQHYNLDHKKVSFVGEQKRECDNGVLTQIQRRECKPGDVITFKKSFPGISFRGQQIEVFNEQGEMSVGIGLNQEVQQGTLVNKLDLEFFI